MAPSNDIIEGERDPQREQAEFAKLLREKWGLLGRPVAALYLFVMKAWRRLSK